MDRSNQQRLLSAVDALIAYAPQLPTPAAIAEWNSEAEPEAGDARALYIAGFAERDAAVWRYADALGIWPLPSRDPDVVNAPYRYASYGCSGLIVDRTDASPLVPDWLARVREYRSAVETAHRAVPNDRALVGETESLSAVLVRAASLHDPAQQCASPSKRTNLPVTGCERFA
jgi:hypothetical protein